VSVAFLPGSSRAVYWGGWIIALLILTLFAISGRASELPLDISAKLPNLTIFLFSDDTIALGECPSPTTILEELHLNRRENPPPIATVLDALSEDWNSPNVACNSEDHFIERIERYDSIFRKIEGRLPSFTTGALVTDRPLFIDYTVLPSNLRQPGVVGIVSLPPEVTTWVSQERARVEGRKLRAALIDTFLLLTVIGAFGSVIFLA
jgi:hypothetical protein